MLYKTQGIIIKKANLGEVDRLLTAYTKEFGKILLKGKSVRKNQSKLKGHLELFLYTHLILAPARGFDIITGAETIESFSELHRSLPCLASACYLSELIDKLIAGPEKDENIWRLLLDSFQKFNGVPSLLGNMPQQAEDSGFQSIVNDFESRLLEFLGYGENQENTFSFIQSLLGEEVKSKYFLQRELCLVK